jgi:hypothetical protein
MITSRKRNKKNCRIQWKAYKKDYKIQLKETWHLNLNKKSFLLFFYKTKHEKVLISFNLKFVLQYFFWILFSYSESAFLCGGFLIWVGWIKMILTTVSRKLAFRMKWRDLETHVQIKYKSLISFLWFPNSIKICRNSTPFTWIFQKN